MAPKASDTSFMPVLIAACEDRAPADRRILTDGLALGMLPAPLRPLPRRPGVRAWLQTTLEKSTPGIWNSIACRKRYFDDVLEQAIRDGIGQLVVLGAGLDTRATRFAATADLDAIEVDQPANVDRKRRRLPLPDRVTLAPIDFERDDVTAVLVRHGYRVADPALFIWEGVTQYLSADAVRATLRALDGAAPGSGLAFTYVRQDFLDGTELYGGDSMYRRFVRSGTWRFGIAPDAVAGLLAEHGWQEVEQVGAAEFAERYLLPAGRADGASPVERCVYARR